MNFNSKMAIMAFIASFLLCNSVNAQSNTHNETAKNGINKSLVEDKVIELDAGTKQISVWTLSDYSANPKEYTLKVVSPPSSGKAIIAMDGVSITYVPAGDIINDKILIEVCHVSGPCDQAHISYVKGTDKNSRLNSLEQ